MNEEIVRRWNSVVGPEDEVFHLGDVALGPWTEWDGVLSRLNGWKTLVIGNHDRVFRGESEAKRIRFQTYYEDWFDVITDEVKNFKIGDHMVNMSHFPYDGDSHDEDRYTEYRLPDDGKTLIHGHTHLNQVVSRSKAGTLQIHVGQDAFDYTPVSEEQIINLLENYATV